MKTRINKIAITFIAVLFIASCSKENEVFPTLTSPTTSDIENVLSENVFKFRYKGEIFSTHYYIKDSVRFFSDPTVAKIISDLKKNPTTSTLTYPDGFTEYFDSTEEVKEFINSGKALKSSPTTFATIKSFVIKIYEHADYKGKSLTFNKPTQIPDMRNVYNSPSPVLPTNFDDIISSFQLIGNRVQYSIDMIPSYEIHFGVIVTFYKDLNYQSSSRSFIIDINNPQISCNNFKNIDFNDEVTSMDVHWYNR